MSVSILNPAAVTADTSGNIYLQTNAGIFSVNPSGFISPFYVDFSSETRAITVDLQGNLLVARSDANTVLRITPTGNTTVIAGTGQPGFSGDGGPAVSAMLNGPAGLAVDLNGNIYIGDYNNTRIRKVLTDGTISTVAGGGQFEVDGVIATQSAVYPWMLACDGFGNLYVAETFNHLIRKVSIDGIISAIAGTGTPGFAGDGGFATSALLNQPSGIAVDSMGNVYIADSLNNRIREILATPPSISVSSTQVTISAPSLGAPTQNDLTVSSSVQGLAYSISFSTQTGGDWLGFSSLQGQAPGVLSITADPSNLQPGTYQGTVTIASPYAAPQMQNISVTFEVVSMVPASLAVGTGPLTFALTAGNVPASTQLTVSNKGGGTLSFSASATTAASGSWLQISPATGTATASTPASLAVTAAPGALSPGTYSGSITVTSSTTGQTVTILVTLAINPSPQTIVLSQTGLTFTAVAQGGSVIPQSIGILNTGSGSMTWSATVNTLSGSGWLSLSATSGTVNRPYLDVSFVDVSVNAQALAPGQYFGSVQVTAPGASNSPQTVLTVLDVLPAGSNPGPQLGPSGLVFTGVAGGSNPGSQTVTIANVTASPVVYGSSVTYVAGNNWIKYLPANATVMPDTPVEITVQPDFTNLAPGVLRAALTLAFDDGSIRTVSILAVVAPANAVATGSVRSGSSLRSAQTTGCMPTKLLPIFTQFGTAPVVPTGWPVAIIAQVVDDCGSPMTSGSVVASFTNGDPPLSLLSLQNGEWSATWQPSNGSTAGVTVSLLAQEPQLGLTGTTQILIGLQGNQTLPTASSGVLNAVTLTQGPIAPGELILLKGSNLADAQVSSSSPPLLQQLAGASILIGGQLSYLLYADTTQLLGLVPPSLPVNSSQQVLLLRDNDLGEPSQVAVAPTQPAIFTESGSATGQALIYNTNGSGVAMVPADASNPVQAGNIVIIYCTGLGTLDSQGNVMNPVSVSVGGQAANVSYAGAALQASFPAAGPPAILGVSTALGGLYQITATIPAGLATGQAAVIVSSAGQTSQQGVTLSINGSATSTVTPLTIELAAAGQIEPFAPESIVSAYGTGLAVSTASATPPLSTSLNGTTVTVTDSAGVSLPALLFYVSPSQVNFEIPQGAANGAATVTINSSGNSQSANIQIGNVSPGIFQLNSSGLVSAWVLPVVSGVQQTLLPVYQLNSSNDIVPLPLSLGPTTEQIYLELYGTGIRNAQKVSVTVGGLSVPVLFAGAASVYAGLDQVNIGPLPRSLAGQGSVNIVVTADGQTANTVYLNIM